MRKIKPDAFMAFLSKNWKSLLIITVILIFFKKIKTIVTGLFSGVSNVVTGVTTVTDGLSNGVKNITDTLGLTTSSDLSAFKAYAGKIGSPMVAATFDQMQKTQPKDFQLITTAAARAIAKQLYDSEGFFFMDENKMLNAFKQCKSKYVVAWVSKNFSKVYNKDLESYLEHSDSFWHGGFKPVYLKAATDYVMSLPNY
jgi:hypothetical protein